MSEELMIRHCSPTLAGLKSANVFSCEYASERALTAELCRLNRRLGKKGIRVIPLQRKNGRALIYVYRPAALGRDLGAGEAEEVLRRFGYSPVQGVARCVGRLGRRVREGEGFPHEIGLFLGYPPEDVRGFIENSGKHYKACGLWKVYGDEAGARRLFDSYKSCTASYLHRYAAGTSIDRLTV